MAMWILVANSATAKLYSSSNLRTDNLHFLKEYSHPDSRKKGMDLISDRPGHYKTDGGARSAYSKGDPKQVEVEHFAEELVKEIKIQCNLEGNHSLIIVAPINLYNLLTKHFKINSYHIHDKITHVAKDYTKYNIQKLTTALKKHLLELG